MTNLDFKKTYCMLILAVALLHIGTIRKNEDPILKTQTDPISLKQKMEEIKDGVKGAPSPSFKYYEKENFMTRSPMKDESVKTVSNPNQDKMLEEVTEVETEPSLAENDVESAQLDDASRSDETSVDEGEDWWSEDDAQDTQAK